MRVTFASSALFAVVLGSAGCDYTAPLDPEADAVLNSIHGTVTFAAPDRPDAPVFVILYDATDPPPPSGTGRPVTFAAIASADFTGASAGIQTAPFALTRIPDGQYLVSALMDVDEDFAPSPSILGGASCGDWLGAHVTDLVSADLATVTVAGGELLQDVSVFLSREMPVERPAFTMPDNTIDRADPTDWQFTLEATDIRSPALDLDGPFEGAPLEVLGACETTFLVHVEDEDGDGAPDPHWLFEGTSAPDGAYAIWPRIYIQYAPEADDPEAIALEPGESYAAEVFVFPDFLVTGEILIGFPMPRNTLTAQFAGQVLHTAADGSTEYVSGGDIPSGAWAVTVVSETGQTWTLPNGLAALGSTDGDWFPELQGATLVVE